MKNALALSLAVLFTAACKKAPSVEQTVEKPPAAVPAPAQDLGSAPAAMVKEAQAVAAAANAVQAQKDAAENPE